MSIQRDTDEERAAIVDRVLREHCHEHASEQVRASKSPDAAGQRSHTEHRRYRSDAELRRQRAALERQWNERCRNGDGAQTLDAITQRVHAEFMEMPDLRLTRQQVQRLCGVEESACQTVLDALVESKFLSQKPGGVYARLTDDRRSRRPSAKASLWRKPRSAKA